MAPRCKVRAFSPRSTWAIFFEQVWPVAGRGHVGRKRALGGARTIAARPRFTFFPMEAKVKVSVEGRAVDRAAMPVRMHLSAP